MSESAGHDVAPLRRPALVVHLPANQRWPGVRGSREEALPLPDEAALQPRTAKP